MRSAVSLAVLALSVALGGCDSSSGSNADTARLEAEIERLENELGRLEFRVYQLENPEAATLDPAANPQNQTTQP